jgi:hypothetical protein
MLRRREERTVPKLGRLSSASARYRGQQEKQFSFIQDQHSVQAFDDAPIAEVTTIVRWMLIAV